MAPQPYEVGSSKFPLKNPLANSDESALLDKIDDDEVSFTRRASKPFVFPEKIAIASFFLKDPTAKESRDRVSNPRPHPRYRERIAL